MLDVPYPSFVAFKAVMERVVAPGFWEDPAVREAVVRSLPRYRVSKFQGLMPGWVQGEVLARESVPSWTARDG